MLRNWRRTVVWVLKANLAVLITDLLILTFWVLSSSADAAGLVRKGYFSLILLLESGIVFILGGVIATSSSIFASKVREHVFRSEEKWSPEKAKQIEKRANLYILLAIFLLAESLVAPFLVP